MKLQDIVNRELPPKPWAEGDKIPWDDFDFSRRMLKEHLSQEHDMASRRQAMVDRHLAWIHDSWLGKRTSRILDLACGPGLYLQNLARFGHTCVGVDFSPASIEHATSQAARAALNIEYIQGDIRVVDYGRGYDLVMLVFGEFNVFRKADAEQLLEKIHTALIPGGRVIMEPQTYDALREDGKRPACWHTESEGLFSDSPHFWLEEHFWHADCSAATTRYFIVDAATGTVDRYASTSQAYTDNEYDALLIHAGFSGIERFPSLAGTEAHRHDGLFVLKAEKE
jgi:SAM-dependent methyltransferase